MPILLLTILLACGAMADESKLFGGATEMSGLSMKDLGDFQNTWHLVTVRFRKDNGEQRFVYANDLAWKALSENQKTFPDGSVFAKAGYHTENDPKFESSRVPVEIERYQIMKKDAAKFASTGVWGYAIFDRNKVTLPEDEKQQIQACFACHKVVRDRDFVFSIPIANSSATFAHEPKKHPELLAFENVKLEKLPANVKRWVRFNTPKLRKLTGVLQKNLFQGTIDEIRPQLATEALRAKIPALISSEDGQHFSIVMRDHSSESCREQNAKSVNMLNVHTSVMTTGYDAHGKPSAANYVTLTEPFCYTND